MLGTAPRCVPWHVSTTHTCMTVRCAYSTNLSRTPRSNIEAEHRAETWQSQAVETGAIQESEEACCPRNPVTSDWPVETTLETFQLLREDDPHTVGVTAARWISVSLLADRLPRELVALLKVEREMQNGNMWRVCVIIAGICIR